MIDREHPGIGGLPCELDGGKACTATGDKHVGACGARADAGEERLLEPGPDPARISAFVGLLVGCTLRRDWRERRNGVRDRALLRWFFDLLDNHGIDGLR